MNTVWILALRHSSTVALGVALLAVGAVSHRALSAPEIPQPREDLELTLAHLEQPSQLALEVPPWREQLEAALDPSHVPVAAPWPTWLSHRRPGVVYHVPPPEAPRQRSHTAPTLRATPSRGQVMLEWTAPELAGLDLVDYVLERQVGEGWVQLALVGMHETRYSEAADGDSPLTYRLTSRVQSDDQEPVSESLLQRSAQATATAEPTWAVVPRTQVQLAVGGDGVFLELYRWTGTEFARSHHTVGVGEPIGSSGFVLREVGSRDGNLAVRVGANASRPPGFLAARWWSAADRPQRVASGAR